MTNDQIGRLAELIAAKDLSRAVRRSYRRPLFRATFLGEKYPTVDFIVDVLDHRDRSLAFFFVQVKGTAGANASSGRIPVDVAAERFNLLVRIPAPTFVIGVDVVAETSFLVAAHRSRKSNVSSITKAYCLSDDEVKIKLYEEVLAFWRLNRPILQQSQFKDV